MKNLIRITIVAFATILLAFLWPEKVANSQARSDSVEKHQPDYVDSFFHAYDSTQQLIREVKRKHKRKTTRPKVVHKTIVKHDTIVVNNTKYRVLPHAIDKEAYWQRQREYTDSIAKAKNDSANWAHRGIFKKIFGPKKQHHEKD